MANLRIGDPSTPFALKGVDGEVHSLAELSQGKDTFAVVFSCNHCPYVLAWEDRLIEAFNVYAPRGFGMVFINANDPITYPTDDFDHMVSHAQEKGFPFPYLHDETQEIAAAYGAERTPEIFLFDREGMLRYHGAPDDNSDETLARIPYLRNAIEAVLKGETPKPTETLPVGCTVKWKT